MLKLISIGLKEYNIKNVHISGNIHRVNNNIDKFKRDNSIRVIMLSSEHSNSGCNLTEANHIIFIDVINDNKDKSKDIECQAIGRSVRLGQQRPVKLIRFITKNTIEEEFYNINKYDIATIQ
jgi:SNF2 family DNA or RNA helicase